MKRDMEVVRSILLALEERSQPYFMTMDVDCIGGVTDPHEMVEYIKMLESGGLLDQASRSLYRLSWAGHEFLDTIRDPEIWRKTKDGANKVGSWSLKLLAELAVGFARMKARELGLPIA